MNIVPLTLGYDSKARKDTPLLAGLFGYFAAALAGIARHSFRSNEKHNSGLPMHWARGKSMDHGECVIRHALDLEEIKAWLRRNPEHPQRAEVVTMLEHEYDARSWRACAESQEFYEEFRSSPLAFNARLPELPRDPSVYGALRAAAVGREPHRAGPDVPGGTSYDEQAERGCIPEEPMNYRDTYPPISLEPYAYPSLWKTKDGQWYFNPDRERAKTVRSNTLYPTETAARAAYWADREAAQSPGTV